MTGKIMTMAELDNVHGRAWEDVDVSIPQGYYMRIELTPACSTKRPSEVRRSRCKEPRKNEDK